MCPSRLFPCLDLKNNYFLPLPHLMTQAHLLSSLFLLNHFVYFSHLLLISGGSYGPPRRDCNQSCRAGGRRCPEQRSWRIGVRSETRDERSHDGWTMSDGLDSGATRANKNADVIITEGERSDASWLLPTARKQWNSSSVSELQGCFFFFLFSNCYFARRRGETVDRSHGCWFIQSVIFRKARRCRGCCASWFWLLNEMNHQHTWQRAAIGFPNVGAGPPLAPPPDNAQAFALL